MKSYSWDRVETKKILNSYRQFLLLKKEHEDWDATILSPCWPVDQMWLQHSQMEDYDFDMNNLLGHVLNRNPPATLSEEDKKKRDGVTKEAMKERFGSYDEELWDTIQLCLVDQLGVEEKIDINRREPLAAVFDQYAAKDEVDFDNYKFTFNDSEINENDTDGAVATPMRLGMENNDKIDVCHVDSVAVTLEFGDTEQSFLACKTEMISKTFDQFAVDVLESERSKFVFLYEGKKVYGYESPLALGLKSRGNVIEAVARENYKYKHCVCCNPQQNGDKGCNNEDEHLKEDDDDASVDY